MRMEIQSVSGAFVEDGIAYPDSDGKPMADNTKQFRWIVTIQGGLDVLFQDDPDVFVAGDLLWYPVKGAPKRCAAPDAMVVFGRPKGDRGSYLQWLEENIPPQVVFEVLSPKNTVKDMDEKWTFYNEYGVEEYYLYNPDKVTFRGWQRVGSSLQDIATPIGWTSPRLGIRFALEDEDLVIYRPDGRRFESYVELEQRRTLVEQQFWQASQRAEHERQQAEQERQRAEHERQQAEQERQRAEHERQQAEHERQRAERLAARLRELGIDPTEIG